MKRLLCLVCSSRSNGEATMAMELLRRGGGRWDLHAAVPTPSLGLARWAGATAHVYPQVSATLARERILRIVHDVAPDALVIADLALLHLSAEFGIGLTWLIPELMQVPHVAALDLWDWDAHGRQWDTLGERVHRAFLPMPPTMGRLLPVPLHGPGPSVPGRARFAIMADQGVRSGTARAAVRARLGLGEHAVVLWTTSAWQHDVEVLALQARRSGWHHAAEAARRSAEHFPRYALRLLEAVARQVSPLTLVHVGPAPFPVPAQVTQLTYRHLPSLPPEEFQALLGSVDAVFSPNLPASSNIRALSLRVPVVAVQQAAGDRVPVSQSPALRDYLDGVGQPYPWSVWPVGLHTPVSRMLTDNPLQDALTVVDVMDPDAVVAALCRVLTDGQERERLQASHERYWRQVAEGTAPADRALDLALGVG